MSKVALPNQFGLWIILDMFENNPDKNIQNILGEIIQNHDKYVEPRHGIDLNKQLTAVNGLDVDDNVKNAKKFKVLKTAIYNNLKGEDIMTLIQKLLEIINNRLNPK